jgi:hypothetical protein
MTVATPRATARIPTVVRVFRLKMLASGKLAIVGL